MSCPFVKNCGRYQVYATTKTQGTQYYKIYSPLCSLYCNKTVCCDIVSTGDTGSDAAEMLTACGGLLPMYAASSMQPVTVDQLPAGTSIDFVAKTENGVPMAVVLGL